MTDTPLVTLRRQRLADEVKAHGQAEIARRANKADRQIGDLIAGRAPFGDRIARDLEPKLRPDLAPGWLVFGASAPAVHEKDNVNYMIELRGEEIGQHLARQAQELATLWLALPPDRRADTLQNMRNEVAAVVTRKIPQTKRTAQPKKIAS